MLSHIDVKCPLSRVLSFPLVFFESVITHEMRIIIKKNTAVCMYVQQEIKISPFSRTDFDTHPYVRTCADFQQHWSESTKNAYAYLISTYVTVFFVICMSIFYWQIVREIKHRLHSTYHHISVAISHLLLKSAIIYGSFHTFCLGAFSFVYLQCTILTYKLQRQNYKLIHSYIHIYMYSRHKTWQQ